MTRNEYYRFLPLLFFWAALLTLVFGGRLYTTDVVAQAEVAGSFIGERPFLTASGEYGFIVTGIREGAFIPHGIGYSILLIPAAIVGKIAGINALKVTGALLNCIWSIILIGAWYGVVRKRYGEVSILRMLVLAIGSMVLIYGRIPFDVTSAAAVAMLGLFLLEDNKLTVAGICIGLAIFIRLDSILLLPIFWRDWRSSLKMLRGIIPFILLIGGANWYRFGSPFLDGHRQDPAMALAPFMGGIPGLFLSPGKGLLYYAPLCVFALFFQKDWRLWLPFVLALFFHGMLYDWTGGTGWGPRFLFITLPFLLIPLAENGKGGIMFWTIGMVGVIITITACWSNTGIIEQRLGADLFSDPTRQKVLWTYMRSPLIDAFRNFGRGVPDLFGATAAQSAGLPIWSGLLAQLTLAAGFTAGGFTLLKRQN